MAWSQGGDVLAGNIGLSVPPEPGIPGMLSVTFQPQPLGSLPGSLSQLNPQGTRFALQAADQSGNPVHAFQAPVTLTVKPNGADLGSTNGNLAALSIAYVVDASTPPNLNPNGLPVGSLLLVPPSVLKQDPANGLISFTTDVIAGTFVVMPNPTGYVQTLLTDTPALSSYGADAQTFGTEPQFSYLRIVEPPVGGRLLVQDPVTGAYFYVNASDVGPSGPPPGLA